MKHGEVFQDALELSNDSKSNVSVKKKAYGI
jgi:hypothetical protein